MDIDSETDSFIIVSQKNDENAPWIKIGQTEIICDDSSPHFMTKIMFNYFFEKKQYIKFEVYDGDIFTSDLIGSYETTANEILGNEKGSLKRKLQPPGPIVPRDDNDYTPTGVIIIQYDSLPDSNHEL